ncbi:MAG: hypothetical protein D6732_24620 [Methanobacteriota archaeon]|nr:MAG: hypothetical protein D6732_24620 [Euryarchaeota archaeon]
MTQNVPTFGIDLGTTNSSISFAQEKKSNGEINVRTISFRQLTENGGLETVDLLPSFFYKEGNSEYVGVYAKAKRKTSPNNVIQSVKTKIGSDHRYIIDGDTFTPVEISAKFLQELKKHASAAMKREIVDAVIAVPANFDHEMRQATLEAARMAGFHVFESDGSPREGILIDEPRAVLYDILNRQQNGEFPTPVIHEDQETNVLVYDFGGGTLDVSLHKVRISDDSLLEIEDLAIGRYTEIGGDTFDKRVRDWIKDKFFEEHPEFDWDSLSHNVKQAFLTQALLAAEEVKYALVRDEMFSSENGGWGEISEGVPLQTGFLVEDKSFSTYITKDTYKQIVSDLLGLDYSFHDYESLNIFTDPSEKRNIVFPVLDVIYKAYKKLGEEPKIDLVLCSGGMTNFSIIRERLEELLNIKPVQIIDPDKAVSRGAAIYGIYRKRGLKITPILAESISLGLEGNFTSILVEQGTTLPVKSKVDEFFVVPKDGTKEIRLPIYKGEHKYSSENQLLKGFVFDLQKPVPAGTNVEIEVEVDVNKIITLRVWLKNDPETKFEGRIAPSELPETSMQDREKQKLQQKEKPVFNFPPIKVDTVLNKYFSRLDQNTETGTKELENKLILAPNGKDAIPKLWKKYRSSSATPAARKRLPFLLSRLYKKNGNEPFRKDFEKEVIKVLSKNRIVISQSARSEIYGAILAAITLELKGAAQPLRNLLQNPQLWSFDIAIIALGKLGADSNDFTILKKILEKADKLQKIGALINSTWSIGKLASLDLQPPVPRSHFYPLIPKMQAIALRHFNPKGFNNNLLRNIIFSYGEMADSRKQDIFDPQQKSILLQNLKEIQENLLKMSWIGLEEYRIKEIEHLVQLVETAKKMILGESLTSEEEETLLTIRSNINVV